MDISERDRDVKQRVRLNTSACVSSGDRNAEATSDFSAFFKCEGKLLELRDGVSFSFLFFCQILFDQFLVGFDHLGVVSDTEGELVFIIDFLKRNFLSLLLVLRIDNVELKGNFQESIIWLDDNFLYCSSSVVVLRNSSFGDFYWDDNCENGVLPDELLISLGHLHFNLAINL